MLGTFTYHLELGAPVLLAWVAFAVAKAPRQERANRLLVAFFATVAAGFLLEFVATAPLAGASSARVGMARALEFGAGLVDPPLLLAFALSYPRAAARSRMRALWTAYVVGAAVITALFVAGGWGYYGPAPNVVASAAMLAYVNGTYLVAFAVLLDRATRERHRFLAREARFVAIAVGFAASSRSAAPFIVGPVGFSVDGVRDAAAGLALALGLLAVVLVAHRVRAPRASRGRTAVARPVAALTLAFFGVWALATVLDEAIGLGEGGFANLYFPLRWIVVAFVMGYGILRYQTFDFELRASQATAVLVAVACGIASAIATGVVAVDAGFDVPPAATVALAAFLAFGAIAYAAVRVAFRLLHPAGEEVPGERVRRLDVYEATLEYAIEGHEQDERARRFVATLSEVFDVTPEEHAAVLERLRRGHG